jgi:hypothetical protein
MAAGIRRVSAGGERGRGTCEGAALGALRHHGRRVGGARAAWNLLIRRAADHGWRARPFEPGEIAHPLLEAVPWQHYRDAALLHATGGALPERVEFLFGHYMQRYFYDPALTLLNVLET